MPVSYKNIIITPNTGQNADPVIAFQGANANVNTLISMYVYPDSNGALSFEGSAGQLFSITNDLSNTIFSVNDVSGFPLLEINVASQQITLGQFYGNVGIGTSASNSSTYKLDVNGSANVSRNLTVDAFIENSINIATSYTITTGRNAMSAGPITINSGVTVTVPSGSTWTIV